MAFRDTWHRTLVYFGLAEDEAYDDEVEPYQEPEVQPQETYRERPAVRRLSTRRRRDEIDDIFADDVGSERRTSTLRPVESARGNGRSGSGDGRVHFVAPKSFNDVQDVADKVFLLTPRNVEVSAEERARLVEKGFFNQS